MLPKQRRYYISSLAFLGLLIGLFFLADLRIEAAAALFVFFVLVQLTLYQRAKRELAKARRDGIALGEARALEEVSLEDRLSAKILEGMTEPLLLVDNRRRVAASNAAGKELFGGEIVGQDAAMFLRQPKALEALELAIGENKSIYDSLKVTSPVERYYDLTINPVTTATKPSAEPIGSGVQSEARSAVQDQNKVYFAVALNDITRAKLAEKMRADFVANASHELRTPLASLMGFIETLQGPAQDDPEGRKRFLSIMHHESTRMIGLIDDLLSLSRIELEKHVRPRSQLNLEAVIESVQQALELAFKTGDRELVLEIAEPLPTVLGDRDQIIQVLQNLVGNSLKYSREKSPITVRAEPVGRLSSNGRPGVKITVQDIGEGIDPAHLPRLTERFYRVDTARSRRLGGTGLGLAIVKHIIERHQGDFQINSVVGEGTSVSVALPLATTVAPRNTSNDGDPPGLGGNTPTAAAGLAANAPDAAVP